MADFMVKWKSKSEKEHLANNFYNFGTKNVKKMPALLRIKAILRLNIWIIAIEKLKSKKCLGL